MTRSDALTLAVGALTIAVVAFQAGHRVGTDGAPEVADAIMAREAAIAADAAASLLEASAAPGDRYEMCDRVMEMAAPIVFDEAAAAQHDADAAAQVVGAEAAARP
jgi:hypothetical protein